MTRIFIPSSGPGDWRCLLADPEKHWKTKKSARTLAHCWEAQDGFPPEIEKLLKQEARFADIEPLFIFPEWKVALPPPRSRPSQNDAWVLAKESGDLISIAIEGKVDEPFDKTVDEWRVDASPGKTERLAYLVDVLGLTTPNLDSIRYQLLHRTASAVIEAERLGAKAAAMIVHSFSPENRWFDDYAAFAKLYGLTAEVGKLVATTAKGGIPLYLGWAHGDERYLES
jgi:hypothetical protein